MSYKIELPNFNDNEFECSCCGTNNTDPKLVIMLQVLRYKVSFPIIINSGYRCEEHNESVGGAGSSSHKTGEGVDIKWDHLSGDQKHQLLKESCALGFGGIGTYKTHIHLDISNDRAWIK